MKSIEIYLKNWRQYDRQKFNEMMLLLKERGLVKKYGDIGDLITKDKRKQNKVKQALEELKEQYGTVTEEKKRISKYRKKFNKDHNTNYSDDEYREIEYTVDELLTYCYETYDPSEVNRELDSVVQWMDEEEGRDYILKWLNTTKNDYKMGLYKPDFSTTYEDVEELFR